MDQKINSNFEDVGIAKDISALNITVALEFLKQNYPGISEDLYFKDIVGSDEFQIIDPNTGRLSPITKSYILNPSSWISTQLWSKFWSNVEDIINESDIAYKAGKHFIQLKTKGFRRILLKLLSGRQMIERMPTENRKLNKTKEVIIVSNKRGYAVVRLRYLKPLSKYKLYNKEHYCKQNIGVYEGLASMAGIKGLTCEQTFCIFEGSDFCEIVLKYQEKNLIRRLVDALKFIIAHELIEELEQRDIENLNLIHSQNETIRARTRVLAETQAKLVETEKRVLEHRITGGFAHEMRNALTGAQLEMKAVLDYQEKGKAATEVIKEAATNQLQKIKDLQAKYQIPKEEIAQTLIPSIKEIAQVIEFLAGTHQDVYHDLERGLSITSQIRDYAKMAELRPGNEPVDLAALLKGYENRYVKDFGDHKIRYSFSGPDSLILQGDETHFNSIFTNLILNARDALLEIEKEDKKIHVSIETTEKDGNPQIQIKVQDNGPGIPESHLSEIFEPFFSTKPSSGTGLGLGIVKRLVQLYGGRIEIESEPGFGTSFTVFFSITKT